MRLRANAWLCLLLGVAAGCQAPTSTGNSTREPDLGLIGPGDDAGPDTRSQDGGADASTGDSGEPDADADGEDDVAPHDAADGGSDTDTPSDSDPPEADAAPDPDLGDDADVERDAAEDVGSDTTSDVDAAQDPDTEPDTDAAPDSDADTHGDAEPDADPDAVSDTDADTDADTTPDTDVIEDPEFDLVDADTDVPTFDVPPDSDADTDSDSGDATDADTLEDMGADPDVEPDVPEVDPLAPCRDRLPPTPVWWAGGVDTHVDGRVAFGQTHLAWEDGTAVAPPLIAGRDTFVAFESTSLPRAARGVAAIEVDGAVLGAVELWPPGTSLPLAERAMTSGPLDAGLADAWTAMLPAAWVVDGAELLLGVAEAGGEVRGTTRALPGLRPQRELGVDLVDVVVFGSDGPDPWRRTRAPQVVARELLATTPFSRVTVNQREPIVAAALIVASDSGPQRVSSFADLSALTGAPTPAEIGAEIAGALARANAGVGLVQSEHTAPPLANAATIAGVWVRRGSAVVPARDTPRGGHGWATTYEVGWRDAPTTALSRALGVGPLDASAVAAAGASADYPGDVAVLSGSVPRPLDLARRELRSWFQVGPDGLLAEPTGRVDASVGGDPLWYRSAPWAAPLTPLGAAALAAVSEQVPDLVAGDAGTVSLVRWLAADGHAADVTDTGPLRVAGVRQAPVMAGIAVVTLVGVLDDDAEAGALLPASRAGHGATFELPDPTSSLPAAYDGGRWFLELDTTDGLIRVAIGPSGIGAPQWFSVNVPAALRPSAARLCVGTGALPDLDLGARTVVDSISIAAPTGESRYASVSSDSEVAGGGARIESECDDDWTCEEAGDIVALSGGGASVRLSAVGETELDVAWCSAPGSALELPVGLAYEDATVWGTLRLQRVISDGVTEIAVAANDATPWLAGANVRQWIRATLPSEANDDLGGLAISDVPLDLWIEGTDGGTDAVELTLRNPRTWTGRQAFDGDAFDSHDIWTPDGAPLYVAIEDPDLGPWPVDGGGEILRAYVRAAGDLSPAWLGLNVTHLACGSDHPIGVTVDGGSECLHTVHVEVGGAGNVGVRSGVDYLSPRSHPLELAARRGVEPYLDWPLYSLFYGLVYHAP
ncbi:MAG: hypothetical protein H6700_12340 [Myxococcales bacterium]|nr:hypothetical protein [Myxococcales bacterium]MCB9532547.1 hypothetical protein [Myxococcales bacterium]